jgi:glycosyltransferase involved in cell wall biosynthesis
MAKVSIIIPARNEKYLGTTLSDIYRNATGDFEVIVGLNGATSYPFKTDYPNLFVWQESENQGLKPMINRLARMAKGDYIYKSDAHCSFGKGFDEILQADMQADWVVTPRFKIIKDNWSIQVRDGKEEFYDYFYLCCPFTDKRGLRFKAGGHWREKTDENLDTLIDETPQMHGSGWFVNRGYFLEILGGFPEDDPDGHAQEPIWLGLKNWLIGGKLMVNKKTWYAHLHQDSSQRGYPEDRKHTEETYNQVASYWLHNMLGNKRLHDFDWFVKKFMPMPSWPENWEELYADYLKNNP